jgi:multiple sugar transport system substrate-binding protein
MWYNKKIFAERGVSGPPKTAEEFYDIAKKLTHTSASGAKVFGWSCRGDLGHAGQMLSIMARMWDGDVITPDFKITVNEAPVINALKLMRRMYAEGIMPPDWHTYGYAGSIKIFREGNVGMVLEESNYWPTFNDPEGMVLEASNYWPTFNDPEKSKIAGNAVVAPYPYSAKLATSKRDFSAGSSWFWAQGILKGSEDKDLAYEFIRHLASQDSAMNMALSGNPPARIDVLSDPKYLDINPGAKIDAMVAPYTKTWIPAFPKNKAVGDIVSEHVHNVVVQGKDPQQEMDEAAKRLTPLLP